MCSLEYYKIHSLTYNSAVLNDHFQVSIQRGICIIIYDHALCSQSSLPNIINNAEYTAFDK